MVRLLLFVAIAAALPAQSLRVLTFNVRYPAKEDGPNAWEFRKDLLVEAFRAMDPDLVGTQELYAAQGDYIVARLPEYEWFGLNRRPGMTDEHMGVFFRRSRLRLLDAGNFWLSETPEQPGSMSWNVSLPRLVTWGVFEIMGTGRRFRFFNTHFAHRREDEEARKNSARLIAQQIAALPQEEIFLMTGDFNAPAGGEVYRILVPGIQDAWEKAARRSGPEGTFHGFSGKPGAARIDWILFRGPLKAREAETTTWNQNGRYPSDHFPVFAIFDF